MEQTVNLVGDFEKEFSRFKSKVPLFALFCKYQEVFGPLPAPGKACKFVGTDIQFKEEFRDEPVRAKCWPLSKSGSDEILQTGLRIA